MKNIILKFIPEKYTLDPEVIRKARLFVSTCFITSFFSSFYLFTSYIADMPNVFWAMLFNVLGFVLLPFIFKTDKIPLKILANTYIAIGAIGVTITVFYTGGLISTVLPWLAVLPITSLMLIDKNSGWVWTIFTCLAIIMVGILTLNGYNFEDETSESMLYIFNILNLNGLGVLIFLIATVFENTRNLALKQLEDKKRLLDQKHKEFTDSVLYAKRIQEAIMPSIDAVHKALKNGFIMYEPKDVVAGDFFWMEIPIEDPNIVYFAAADCTGHGVPGAMVSVVCSTALTKALLEEGIRDTGRLLDRTRDLVITQLAKGGEEVKDGMDISLCALNTKTNQLQWSGANNPIWIVRKKELIDIKPVKQPIGKYTIQTPFISHQIELEEGDFLYVFTDGFQDQFGGPKGKKYKTANFKKLLLSINENSISDQKQIIESTFHDWKGELEQVDDVCIIGVKV